MRVLFVTSEAHPLAKSGGLADVSGALPTALKRRGIDIRLMLPAYPSALVRLKNPRIEARLEPMLGVEGAALISGQLPNSNVPVWLVHAPSLFLRSGGLYQDEHGRDWEDNALRFAFLAKVAAKVAQGRFGWKPDVVHANDWHTGLLPLFLRLEAAEVPRTVFTIHNLAYQGNFSRDVLPALDIPERCFNPDGLEFYSQASFLKAGIRYADTLTTVSPTYAQEVLTPAFGCGFDGILRSRRQDFLGILNGIDDTIWNPAGDGYLPATYNARDISGKRLCKAELQKHFDLEPDPDVPLVAYVSRLAHQKMADVLLDAVPRIADSAQFILVGKGDPGIEAELERIGAERRGRIGVHIGYAESLAHRLQAGADILLAPARYEPCGLTQLYALRYGTVPVVSRTGGLRDTVTDVCSVTLADRSATGFMFDDPTAEGLLGAVERAIALRREPLAWRRLQLEGMAQDFSWHRSAGAYAALYGDTHTTSEAVAEESARQAAS